MSTMKSYTDFIVNISTIRRNILNIKNISGADTRFCAVVKANAYSHGLIPVVRNICDMVDCFAVACLKEAMTIRLVDKDTDDIVWFIYPYEKEFTSDIIIISNVVKTSPLWQRDIYDITLPNKRIHDILRDTFHESMIFYASDLCGTDFKQVIDFTIKK